MRSGGWSEPVGYGARLDFDVSDCCDPTKGYNMTLCEHLEAAIALASGEVKEKLEALLADAGCVAVANSGGGPGGVDPDKDK